MSNIARIEFPALTINGENYMSWMANVKRHLKSKGVLETINEGNKCTEKDKAIADVFLHKHIDEMLQVEYSNYDDPYDLWKDLQSRFDNQKEVLLPAAKDEWMNLRFQDFRKVNDYTSALFRICSTLRFCGHPVTEEQMLEKTYSTFHASNMSLWERNRGHSRRRGHGRSRFSRNHVSDHAHSFKGNNNYRGRGRGHGHNQRNNTYHAPQKGNFNEQNKLKNEASTSQNRGDSCHRCGMMNHWSKACRTPEHLCMLYQTSLKGKEKEVNHVGTFENRDIELNNSDFLNDYEA
ncbi:hypothetical protein SSX86_007537 [Deinandra increscens subsp. villosa]|uniref:CCHC-type domain-containing protein n=1 Tax=Deinandra increscens subsp. villosa TaxID=3103831 RepID=A0AAP0H365_9ASTR